MTLPNVRILIADQLNPVARQMLSETAGVEVDDRAGISPEELIQEIGGYDAILVRSRTKVTRHVMEAGIKLKLIGRAGIGVDNIDVPEATRRGIIVMNAPNGNSVSAAELAIAHICSISRHIVNATQTMRAGGWDKKKFKGREISGSTLGLIGLGSIGQVVATRARGLHMTVAAYDPFVAPERMKELEIVPYTDLHALLKTSDYISLHTPLTPKTRNIIGAAELKKMKTGAYLINCARGGVVDESALLNALQSGEIAGAALDVFETEPPDDSPLLSLPNVQTTPHLGASTEQAQLSVAKEIVEGMTDFFVRNVVRNAINMPKIQEEEQATLWPFVQLAMKLGSFAGQYHEGNIEDITVDYHGDVFQKGAVAMITNAALKGILAPGLGEQVNIVNAPMIASGNGIKVEENVSSEPRAFTRLITIRISGAQSSHEVRGTVFGEDDSRIVRIDDRPIEAALDGHLIVSCNEDVPGIIGKLGTLLGDAGINVSGLKVSPPSAGNTNAIAIWRVDQPVPEEVLTAIRTSTHLYDCTYITV